MNNLDRIEIEIKKALDKKNNELVNKLKKDWSIEYIKTLDKKSFKEATKSFVKRNKIYDFQMLEFARYIIFMASIGNDNDDNKIKESIFETIDFLESTKIMLISYLNKNKITINETYSKKEDISYII